MSSTVSSSSSSSTSSTSATSSWFEPHKPMADKIYQQCMKRAQESGTPIDIGRVRFEALSEFRNYMIAIPSASRRIAPSSSSHDEEILLFSKIFNVQIVEEMNKFSIEQLESLTLEQILKLIIETKTKSIAEQSETDLRLLDEARLNTINTALQALNSSSVSSDGLSNPNHLLVHADQLLRKYLHLRKNPSSPSTAVSGSSLSTSSSVSAIASQVIGSSSSSLPR